MINLRELDRYRIDLSHIYGSTGNERCGAFMVPSCIDRQNLGVIVAADDGWDHVSVSRPDRDPTWREMEQVKRLFFLPDECAMQLHPPIKTYVNHHQHCLHLWRPHGQPVPVPPLYMV